MSAAAALELVLMAVADTTFAAGECTSISDPELLVPTGAHAMSKGMDRKKETKKKPAKTKEEKRAEKRAKQAGRHR